MCLALQTFWKQLHTITQKCTDQSLPYTPAFFLLHHSNIPLKEYQKSVLRYLVNTAHSCTPTLWKSSTPPFRSLWFYKIEDIRNMDSLASVLKGMEEKNWKIWFHWTHTPVLMPFSKSLLVNRPGVAHLQPYVALSNGAHR